MDIQYGNLANLNYLWLVAAVAVAIGFAAVARRRAVRQFATANLVDAIFHGRRNRPWLKSVLTLASLAALVLAIIDVRWGKTWREVPQKGIEVVFALDVSRSMLAEDVAPNRLGRAKQQIKDMVDEMQGDRIGLVVFAGDAKRTIPLTTHYDDFKRTLDEVGPQNITHGGSSLGDAIRVASESFLAKTSDNKAIVLFTDGEDHESKPVTVAKRALSTNGVRVFTVGLGDDSHGARVPVHTARRGNDYLEHDGQQVWSKLDGSILKEIATATDGAYVPAGTKQVDMSRVYRDYVAQVEQQEFETARINGYVPRFQWFLGAALLLTLAEALLNIIPARKIRETSVSKEEPTMWQSISSKSRRASKISVAAAVAIMALFLGGASSTKAAEADAYALAENAANAMQAGNYEVAATQYRQAAELTGDLAAEKQQLEYDTAVALYRKGDLDEARQLFTSATSSSDRELESKARFNLANCDYAEALKLAKGDRAAAKVKARSAISHYRGALAANPNDGDALSNIELAGLLIQQLNEAQQQEEQQQQQDQPQDQQSDSQDNPQQQSGQQQQDQQSDSQDNPQQQSGQQQQDQQSDSQDNPQQQSGQQQQQDQQSDSQDNQQQQSGQQQQQDQQSGSQDNPQQQAGQPRQQDQQSGAEQKDQSQQPDDSLQSSDGSKASDGDSQQETASSSKSQANRSDEDGQQNDENLKASDPQQSVTDQGQEASKDVPDGDLSASNQAAGQVMSEGETDPNQPMTRQEALKMLQSVRDRDLMRRLQNQRNSQRRYVPGDKDW